MSYEEKWVAQKLKEIEEIIGGVENL